MDALRWSLLVIGIAVVVGLYVWGRWRSKDDWVIEPGEDSQSETEHWQEPDTDAVRHELHELGRMIETDRQEEYVSKPRRVGDAQGSEGSRQTAALGERVVVLYVVAPQGERFSGEALRRALEQFGLEHGEMGIFHRREGEHSATRLFSAANLVEPGWFDLERLAEQSLPGVALFIQLPGPPDALAAFDAMVDTAYQLADELGGELKDERRSALTRQTVGHLREEVREYQRQIRLATTPRDG